MRLLVSISEASEMLSVGRTTIYELAKRGDVELVHLGRRSLVVVESLERCVASRRSPKVGVHNA